MADLTPGKTKHEKEQQFGSSVLIVFAFLPPNSLFTFRIWCGPEFMSEFSFPTCLLWQNPASQIQSRLANISMPEWTRKPARLSQKADRLSRNPDPEPMINCRGKIPQSFIPEWLTQNCSPSRIRSPLPWNCLLVLPQCRSLKLVAINNNKLFSFQ